MLLVNVILQLKESGLGIKRLSGKLCLKKPIKSMNVKHVFLLKNNYYLIQN